MKFVEQNSLMLLTLRIGSLQPDPLLFDSEFDKGGDEGTASLPIAARGF